jgi:sulfofructosephosphate aldolase
MTLDALAYPDGTFAMVAMDQRESLRTMLAEHGRPDDAEAIGGFKDAVARTLGPLASGFLIDAGHGLDRLASLPDGVGRILAVDALIQERGGPVTDTHLDRAVDPQTAKRGGAVALKLLVIWKRDDQVRRRLEMSAEFIELCAGAGLLSVLEPVAQPEPGTDLDAAIIDAAEALGPLRPSLYKAQVPSRGIGETAAIVKTCERITEILPVPWVVLSNGVAYDDFPRAVELACAGGASGTLAGRALWTPALTDRSFLEGPGRDRLRMIADTVRRTGRPWRDA